MPTYTKDVLYPGTYRLADGRRVTFTPEKIAALTDRAREMMAAGLSIPVCWEHQDASKPGKAANLLASSARQNLGFVQGAEVTGEGYLSVLLDVPADEDAKRLPSVRFVSPEIVNDYIDGDGRLWPGASLTHVAVTPRPVQHRQKPFAPVRMSTVRLSMGDYEMAEEKKDEVVTEGGGVDLKKVLAALANHGINLPEDTSDSNFMERLYVAVTALSEEQVEEKNDIVEEPPVTMSLQKVQEKLLAAERKGLEQRIDRLRKDGKITKAIHGKLTADLKTERLSLDGQGDLQLSKVAARIEAYEELEGVQFHGPQRLSQGITEVEMPDRQAPKTEAEVARVVDDWDRAMGRRK